MSPDFTAVDRVLEAGRLANLPVMIDFGRMNVKTKSLGN